MNAKAADQSEAVLTDDTPKTYRVHTPLLTILPIVGLVTVIVCAYFFGPVKSTILAFVLVPCLWGLAWTGTLEICKDGIRYITVWGQYELKWQEITAIESNKYCVVLRGKDDKVLPLPGPGYWFGWHRRQFQKFFWENIKTRNTPITKGRSMVFVIPKGTRTVEPITALIQENTDENAGSTD